MLGSSGQHKLFAIDPVPKGGLLLQVPEQLFMTANTAVKSKLCGKLVRSAELSEWQALVLHLLCERAAGPASFWAPYIAVLGDQRHHPLMWSQEQRGQLEGSAMLRTLNARLQTVQEDTELLLVAGANDLEAAAAWQQQTQSPLVSASSVCWAAAVLLGRAFSLDLSEPDLPCEGDMSYFGSWQAHGPAALALVPWADMARHSSDAGDEAMLLFDPEARAALLTAHTDYAAGAEVFDSHGPGLSAADLLMDHGCVGEGEEEDNPRYDALLCGHLKPRGSRNAALLQALQGLTGYTEGEGPLVSLTPSGPDPMGMAVLRAGLASDAELIQAGWRIGSKGSDVGLCARVMGRLGLPKSVATEQRVLGVLGKVVEACIAAYPRDIEQDEAELQQLLEQQRGQEQQQWQQQDEQQQLRISVLKALISEKTALLGCQEVITDWQQQLEALAAAGPVKAEQLMALYGSQGDEYS